jgi:CxxC-x17-CxxC domain-containing protein
MVAAPRHGSRRSILEEVLSFADRTLVCRDCGREFTFTGGEQEFYASKGLTNDPVRCTSCRSSRKASSTGGGGGGGGFQAEDNGGYVRYGTFASFGGRTPRQMHPASCAECGMMTEVPFVPRGDRPVYCSSCYNKIRTPRV